MAAPRKSSSKAADAALGDAPAEGQDVIVVGAETHEIAPVETGTVIKQDAPMSLLELAGLAEPKDKAALVVVEPAVVVDPETPVVVDPVVPVEPEVLAVPDPAREPVRVECLAGMYGYGGGKRCFLREVVDMSPEDAERGISLGAVRKV